VKTVETLSENFSCVMYRPGDEACERLLETYFTITDVENNKTRKNLRVEMYDGTRGALFFVVETASGKPVGLTSCVRYDEDGVVSAKIWHRLHLMPEVPRTVIDRYLEPATFDWCLANDIHHVWVTFNESMPRTAAWAAARMGERRNAVRPNPFSSVGREIRQNWKPHGKLIFERHTWQYVIYYSPDGKFFLRRDEKDLDSHLHEVFRKEFPDATRDWIELAAAAP
jgi:hypothetical protein